MLGRSPTAAMGKAGVKGNKQETWRCIVGTCYLQYSPACGSHVLLAPGDLVVAMPAWVRAELPGAWRFLFRDSPCPLAAATLTHWGLTLQPHGIKG